MLPNDKKEPEQFAVALVGTGRFAPTNVGGFLFLPAAGRHVWDGKMSTTMGELADQMNLAMKAVAAFGDPFMTIEVINISGTEYRIPEREEDDSALWKESNALLLDVIEQAGNRTGKLRPLLATTT